ncbi:ABC transporter ATP-binding protein [Halosimplex aquaticum]|uniref:ABC-type D-xylose/L-arabinose transporter n=1 Tax=Halosimplex aquaticum TaxID=3026162 RepID=A0ABD5Y213_9EURY|nr:sn-glycerol-3-phosphate ABC transporter ATP-binding protein UgpC [Halosimplex aquaticum]
MARVEFDDVTKVYQGDQDILAVEGLDIEIPDGEFTVIVGPSGCGKSTTLRMVAGLEDVTDGDIRIGDEVVNDVAPRNRDIAMVFQSYALYPHKSVRGNIGYGLQLSTDLTDEEIDKRVEEAAEMMGIEDLLDKKPGDLSGGQRQRVATGRAIVREPAVFLFDEPLSNLDAKLRKHMRTELARIHAELGITSIYVTHDQEEAMTLADRIVVLNEGTLQQVAPPKVVYNEPANRFVANFIGSPTMNFFDVEVDGDRLVADEFEYAIGDAVRERVADGDRLTLGVRPEDVEVDGDAPDERSVTATVEVVEVVGSDNVIYLDLGGEEYRVRTDSAVEPSHGTTVRTTFDDSDIHLFDADTGEALFHGPADLDTAQPSARSP